MRLSLVLLVLAAAASKPTDRVDYGRDVRPILSRNCFVCHGPDEGSRERELRLDRFDDATRDRGGYRAIVPGDSKESEVFLRILDDVDPMPPKDAGHTLAADEIEILRRWIDEGAEYAPHWAFVAPRQGPLPDVRDGAWPAGPIDRFVLARLEREGLAPSPRADRHTLARRVSLDLIGLPPTPDAVRAFVADEREDAYERFVDGLLASPAYGERWASVWLDLARYADSAGHGSDPLRVIWRYRDWVIDALNANMPFDVFTVEQLAGDLLPDATMEQRLATAFHRNTMTNTEGGTDDEEFRVAAVKDRAITTAQVWLGLTLGCAQCHSHKYDPLSHEDFYSFYAFFNQTADTDKNDDRPWIETPRTEDLEAVADLRARIAELEGALRTPEHDVAAARAAWEAEVLGDRGGWRILRATDLESRGGAGLVQQDDGSVLALGDSPDTDVYTVDAEAPFANVTALRLEVLPHDSLASGGPGRLPGIGNVVLNDITLAVAPRELGPVHYVRVTNVGDQEFLSLAELEVFRADENVARSAQATQSSTAYEGPARLAIDGDRNGDYHAGRSVTHTARERDPWLELDLGADVEVDRIRVWNRTDGGLQRRLAGFTVQAFDAERNLTWSAGVRNAPYDDLELDLREDYAPVLFGAVSADYSDADWGVELAVDADTDGQKGWGLNPQLGGSHVAVFETASPLAGDALRVTLRQEFGGHHTLGRFRLSVTDATPPRRALPHAVASALAAAPEERSPEQVAALERHYQTIDPVLARIRGAITEVEEQIVALAVPRTPVMVELPPDQRRKTHVMLRGNFLQPGVEVQPDVPGALHDWSHGEERDRLALARWIVDPANPLMARVTVNRLWARLFGRGIVETEEDFGTQGRPPTHPALLDWLALELVRTGWDVKALLKTVVMSSTYRQTSVVSAMHVERDPRNVLFTRGPRFRMEAEMVRDVLLATSGLLSTKMHGPSVYPPQPDGLWQAAFNGQRTWSESSGEDRRRRGLYVFLRRSIPYPALATFDATGRESCTVRRSRTNTPLQAFVTLNDPVYVEAAQALARRIVREGGETTRARASYGLELCLLRQPDEARVDVVEELFATELAHYAENEGAARALATDPLGPLEPDEPVVELAAWTVVANVLLNQDALLVKD
ncbi:MAG: DUF1553 domain-containing protein [bacterium]|nr:DUF1553 domain-containing protein [bacterium]